MIKTKTEMIFNVTEDKSKLIRAINNLFEITEDEIKIITKGDNQYLFAEIDGLKGIQKLYEGLRNQKIIQTARKILMGPMDSEGVSFLLNKQALYMNKFHFCETPSESPMGPVWIRIISDNIERLLEYLVPETRRGKVLEVNYIPE